MRDVGGGAVRGSRGKGGGRHDGETPSWRLNGTGRDEPVHHDDSRRIAASASTADWNLGSYDCAGNGAHLISPGDGMPVSKTSCVPPGVMSQAQGGVRGVSVSTLVLHQTRTPLGAPLTGMRTLAGVSRGLLLSFESLGWPAVETGDLGVGGSGDLGCVPTPLAVVPHGTSDMASPSALGSCVDSYGGVNPL